MQSPDREVVGSVPFTECGFCDGGIWISSRRLAEGLPPEVPCPYCDGARERTERGEPDDRR